MINHRIFMTGCLVVAGLSFFLVKMWPFGVICLFLAVLIFFKASDAPFAPTPRPKKNTPAQARGKRKSKSDNGGDGKA